MPANTIYPNARYSIIAGHSKLPPERQEWNVAGYYGTTLSRIELPFNCGACGYPSCAALVASGGREGEDFAGPTCVLQAIDLGIALGSAVKLAAELSIDNRIMYTVGATAKDHDLLDSDIIIGIPLSATGKNPFFDRP